MKKSEVIENIDQLVFKGIAHRGYHNEKMTENGLKAFQNALDNNLAIELDVHLTKDDKLIVCHDSSLERTTGKKGIIEDLTSDYIRENYRLLDGGVVPTFQEVLELVDEKVPLVVELKVYNKNYKPLAKRVKIELKNVKNKKKYMLISFDPRSIIPFKKSGFMRMLLVCESHKWVYSLRHFFEGVDLDQNLFKYKKVRNYSKKHLVNVWTITDTHELDNVINYVDLVTFQNMDYQIVENALKNK